MLLQNKKLAIIGGGPGGLTLAKLLRLKDVDVKVYERDVNEKARVQGSPLDLHDESGLAALDKAGLIPVFKQNYMPGADRKKIMNEDAAVLFSDHEGKAEENFGHEHFRPEIDRGVLRSILLKSLEPGTVVWNRHFLSMEPQGEGWLLHFKGEQDVYADMVIAADGANSKIRPYITAIKPFYSGITMLEGHIDDAKNTAPLINDLLCGGKIMAFGKEQNLLMGQKANGEIGFYASFKAPENWSRECGLDFSDRAQLLKWFKKEYFTWNGVWTGLFESATLPFIPRPIYCMPLNQDWEALSNLTMIGDAAHVMPPFAGEGVNMAMLDALELSERLTESHFGNIKQAISSYETSMRKRAAAAAKESLENGERMHAENALETMTAFFSSHASIQ